MTAPVRSRARALGWGPPALVVALALLAAGCGEPTAQLVRPDDSRFTFEIPVEFTDLTIPEATAASPQAYGRSGTPLTELAAEPVLFMTANENGDLASYQSLRVLSTGGQFDPIAPEGDPLPDGVRVLDYLEINEASVWGVRVRLVIGQGVSDFQALVDRQSDQIVVTEMLCTQACFVEQRDLIDQIQQSWSLDS